MADSDLPPPHYVPGEIRAGGSGNSNGHKPYDKSLLDADWFTSKDVFEQANKAGGDEWVWDGYLMRGVVTLLAGRPKVGKSTLLLGLVEAIGSPDATEFLGRKVIKDHGYIPYITEENVRTLKHKVSPYGRYWTRHKMGTSMEDVLKSAAVAVNEWGSQVIVIDTFSFWAQFKDNESNDSDAVRAALKPILKFAQDNNVAVLLVHHQRKDRSVEGETSVGGATAFTGDSDIVLTVEKPPSREEYTGGQRILSGAGSRHPGTPIEWVYDYDPKTGAFGTISEEEVPEITVEQTLTDGILQRLAEATEPVSTEALAKSLHRNINDVRDEAKRMETKCQISRAKKGRKQGWTLDGTKLGELDTHPDTHPGHPSDTHPGHPSDTHPDISHGMGED